MRIVDSSHRLTRRQILAAALAGSSVWGAASRAQGIAAKRKPIAVRRWDSGNDLLAPLTRFEERVLFAGNKTIGCINPDAPKLLWNVAHGFSDEAVYRPRVVNKTVVAGGLAELGAWDSASGRHKWRHKAITQIGVPWVTQGLTYVGDGHELLALDTSTGALRWRFAGTPDTLASYAPTVSANSVFFASGNGVLNALSLSDGRLKWTLDRSEEWQYLRQLYVSKDVLVAGSYKELLYGISTSDGKVLWTFNAGNFINSHHVAGDTAYLWSPTGWIYAIDIRNGDVRWRHQTTNYGQSASNWAPMMAELVTHGGNLYALDMGNVLHVISIATGAEVSRVEFSEALRPTVVPRDGGQAVVATEGGHIQRVRW
ncbi:MAG: hypothetical protein RLZ68_366 [Pseudomonadota bacterium]